jgi:hypothetical protein
MNHAIRVGGAASQAVEIFDIASMHGGSDGSDLGGRLVRAGEPHYVMAGVQQFFDDG